MLKYTLKKVASSIKQAGLDVCVFKSRDYDRAVVKVRATVGRLRKHAAQTGFVAKLRDREVKDRLRRGLEDVDAPGEYKIYPRCAAASLSLAAARRRREASRRWRRRDLAPRERRRDDAGATTGPTRACPWTRASATRRAGPLYTYTTSTATDPSSTARTRGACTRSTLDQSPASAASTASSC